MSSLTTFKPIYLLCNSIFLFGKYLKLYSVCAQMNASVNETGCCLFFFPSHRHFSLLRKTTLKWIRCVVVFLLSGRKTLGIFRTHLLFHNFQSVAAILQQTSGIGTATTKIWAKLKIQQHRILSESSSFLKNSKWCENERPSVLVRAKKDMRQRGGSNKLKIQFNPRCFNWIIKHLNKTFTLTVECWMLNVECVSGVIHWNVIVRHISTTIFGHSNMVALIRLPSTNRNISGLNCLVFFFVLLLHGNS